MDQPKSKAEQRRETRTASGGNREKPDKPRKDKKEKAKGAAGGSKRSKKNKKDVPKPMTRVVIRHLPPTMTEESFREQISVDGKMPSHDEFYFVGPDWSLGSNAFARAYINFTDPEDVFRFTDSYDGYTFVDAKGMEFQAMVEYAPLQKPPKARSRKTDAKCGTIESDSHLIAFKEALEAEEQEALHGRGTQEFSFKLETENKTTSTPLLEFIAQRKQEKRDERRRKQEEKRKARDEERHTRKAQVSKGIPPAIKEEKEGGGEVAVRTVLSRLNLAQNAPKAAGASEKKTVADSRFKDDKDKKAKNTNKEKDRKEVRVEKRGEDTRPPAGGSGGVVEGEKNAGKKQDRDKPGKKPYREKEKARDDNRQQQQPQQQQQPPKGGDAGGGGEPAADRQKKEQSSVIKHDPAPKPTNEGPPTDAAGKKEVKKYSERRKETRARAETRFAEQDSSRVDEQSEEAASAAQSAAKIEVKKSIFTANVAPFIPKEKTTIILAGPSSTATNNPATQPSARAGARKAVTPISEETTTDNGKSPSPKADAARHPSDENIPPKGPVPNEKIREKLKEAREARKIRNKDRPSIEIYQPRKRIVSGGAGKSEEDRGRSDSDRPSDNVSTSAAAAGSEDGAKERRHKLTKKASDRQQRERKNGRKNSTDLEGSNNASNDIGWWM